MSYAHRLGSFVAGMGLAIAAVGVLLHPPLAVLLALLGNCAVPVWWGVHVFVTRRPW